MSAQLTIEQMILNHNIGVNFTDAERLGGLGPESFSKTDHEHAGEDITTGTINAARLPVASETDTGAVRLSSSITSNSKTLAATPNAVMQIKALVDGKAPTSHKHFPSDINTGTFPNILTATNDSQVGVRQIRNIILSNVAPSPGIGQDGDVYYQYE